MADKFLNRDSLLKFAENHISKSLTMNDIASFPAADVAPVNTGHWNVTWYRYDNYASGHDYEFSECECHVMCSNCHYMTRIPWEKPNTSYTQIRQVAMLRDAKTNYCPNCGAKMDREEQSDDS